MVAHLYYITVNAFYSHNVDAACGPTADGVFWYRVNIGEIIIKLM